MSVSENTFHCSWRPILWSLLCADFCMGLAKACWKSQDAAFCSRLSLFFSLFFLCLNCLYTPWYWFVRVIKNGWWNVPEVEAEFKWWCLDYVYLLPGFQRGGKHKASELLWVVHTVILGRQSFLRAAGLSSTLLFFQCVMRKFNYTWTTGLNKVVTCSQ